MRQAGKQKLDEAQIFIESHTVKLRVPFSKAKNIYHSKTISCQPQPQSQKNKSSIVKNIYDMNIKTKAKPIIINPKVETI